MSVSSASMALFSKILAPRRAKLYPATESGLIQMQNKNPPSTVQPPGLSWDAQRKDYQDTSSESVLRAFASLSADQVLELLKVDQKGLSSEEARSRLLVKGPNILRSQKRPSWIILLLKVIPNPFNILLVVLAVLTAAIPPAQWGGFAVLMVMVVVSVLVRFWQEFRSSLAVFQLQMSIKESARVRRRDIEDVIPTSQLVPGDIVMLRPGDIVPADCLVLEAAFLRVSQSQWTGESLPVSKMASSTGNKTEGGTLFDLSNICFMGTGVVSGNATVLILQTGSDALIAEMSKALRKGRDVNAFQRGIQHVTWMLIAFMLVMVPIVLGISAKTTGSWSDAALFSISVAVGLVPEMLPAIVNANLARGAYLLSKKKGIVRRLDSVQNLGAMTVLCSDKTGTLTKDEISLRGAVNLSGSSDNEVLKLAVIEATIQGAAGNNMDAAIRDYRPDDDTKVQTIEYENTTAIPFDFERRRSACIVRGTGGGALLICKGAFEEVFARCTMVHTGQGDCAMTSQHRFDLKNQVQTLNSTGFRVLLIATKQLSSSRIDDEDNFEGLETAMTVHGLLTFVDPPKPDAAESINKLKGLGVEVKVLTGDNLAVALNVCQALGLIQRQDVIESDGPQAMTGADLATLIGEDFEQAVKSCKLFAKVTPDQKDSIIASLKRQGNTVGMLGDGMNDCLALRKADVGISVDSAAGAAKDCADFILTEKGLAIVVDSVTIGRVTHANSIKYIKMVFSTNFGNVFSVLIGSAWFPFNPITNLQILVQNLLYDISQIAIPWDNVDAELLENPKSWQPWDLLRFVLVLGPTSSVIDMCTFSLNWFYYRIRTAEDEFAVKQFQTHWFLEGLLTQTLIVHLLRTGKLPFVQSRASIHLLLATAAIMAIGFALPWIPVFHRALSFENPRPSFVGFLALELLLYCIEVEIVKRIYIKLFKRWL